MTLSEIRTELKKRLPAGGTVGLIGYGAFGQQIAEAVRLEQLDLLVSDPVRAADESAEEFGEICTLWGNGMGGCTYQSSSEPVYLPLDHLLKNSDLLILAVPLTEEGPCPTRGMVNASFRSRMRSGAQLWNLSDPAVADHGVEK